MDPDGAGLQQIDAQTQELLKLGLDPEKAVQVRGIIWRELDEAVSVAAAGMKVILSCSRIGALRVGRIRIESGWIPEHTSGIQFWT